MHPLTEQSLRILSQYPHLSLFPLERLEEILRLLHVPIPPKPPLLRRPLLPELNHPGLLRSYHYHLLQQVLSESGRKPDGSPEGVLAQFSVSVFLSRLPTPTIL